MKRISLGIFVMCIAICMCIGCNKGDKNVDEGKRGNSKVSKEKVNEDVKGNNSTEVTSKTDEGAESKVLKSLINSAGNTLETRIGVPNGYTRTQVADGSFGQFLRNYEMKPDKSKVLLYSGSPKGNQEAHVAVFKLPIENYDLQQCADSVMRMYAEYYWHNKQYNKIAFHFVSGFNATYSKWIQGYNIRVSGSSVSWVRDSNCNSSYESFKKYLRMVFNYASTLSMDKESKSINIKDIQAGDLFIIGGSPGHVVMVVDVATNAQGKKAFLLAQGYMPAQEFHVLKNPSSETDMWYYEENFRYPLDTPEYMFDEGTLKRPNY